ncbi:unnamed protein product, partial [Amoebophrya sp. A120]
SRSRIRIRKKSLIEVLHLICREVAAQRSSVEGTIMGLSATYWLRGVASLALGTERVVWASSAYHQQEAFRALYVFYENPVYCNMSG